MKKGSLLQNNCKDIEGFLLPGAGGLQFKISQYADDATCILKSEKSLCHALNVVRKFEPCGSVIGVVREIPLSV